MARHQTLLDKEQTLISLGYEGDSHLIWEELIEAGLPVTYMFGSDQPRVLPELLEKWLRYQMSEELRSFPFPNF